MRNTFYILILLSIVFTSCDEEKTIFSLVGQVVDDTTFVSDASVIIDNADLYATVTDTNGRFSFEEVTIGSHDLKIKKTMDDGSYIARTLELEIENNTDLLQIPLPQLVDFDSIVLDTATNTLVLKWNKSLDDNFEAYHIYASTNAMVAENEDNLYYSTNDINDTMFEYIMPSLTKLFFKVKTFNAFGTLSLSKKIDVEGANANLLQYGNIEFSDNFLEIWNLYGSYDIIDTASYEGEKAILMQSLFDTTEIQYTNCKIEAPGFFVEEGSTYRLSFYYKAHGLVHNDYPPIRFYYTAATQQYLHTSIGSGWLGTNISGTPFRRLIGVDWTAYEIIFQPNSDYELFFTFFTLADYLYLDNLRCEKVLEEVN